MDGITDHAQDLIVVVADKNMESAISGILSRYQSLGIRPIIPKILVHMHRDPGCRLESHLLLQPHVNDFSHAIVMFDREGCGLDQRSREELETSVEQNLSNAGWGDRAIALVLDPELEIWVWKDSPHVESALGWSGKQPNLRLWLQQNGFQQEGDLIPRRPKEAMEAALREVHRPRSSSIYFQLARTVSLRNCNNPTFLKLRNALQNWFQEDNS